ncbi:MAG: hypothetical protein HOV71_22700 [Hamadaea sp.]|nr:hypothetical protein [Hamadaea sp.]NUR50946.1 hypothetical protein [Hamadaea sp.]NUT06876.1 hypothetical protein [Hamadaea sp.]
MGDEKEPSHRLDLVLTVVMALAAVGTAWAGFESTKWGGVQANAYAAAGAVRAEAGRAANRAGQQRIRDLVNFTSWLNALNEDLLAGKISQPAGAYTPTPGTLSGFLYDRFRPGFEPVIKDWVATRPLLNPNSPATPFDLPGYVLPDEDRASTLNAQADALTHEAQAANQRGDNYVLTAVIFALVLFFAGVAGRARARRTQFGLTVLAVVALAAAIITLATFPVEI